MIYAPEILDILQSAAMSSWEGTVYRHMFGGLPPDRGNTLGARWNPPALEAIYTSREKETALAEAEYSIVSQPLRPKAKRTIYTIRVSLKSFVDLTGPNILQTLGITDDVLSAADQSPCRLIGSAVHWLGYDGLLVPSARRVGGTNLVIYQQEVFEVTGEEVISSDAR